MIRSLYIKDFILIESLQIDLFEGFTAITGETGAGKSILIGAIGLILGNRADSKSVREGASKAIIEAECDLEGIQGVRELMEREDLDYSPTTLIRREITPQGKSRAFINDTPVNAGTLKLIGERLVDIHSQHHNMLIGDADFQMNVLDTLAGDNDLLTQFQQRFQEYKAAKVRLEDERREVEEMQRSLELAQFQAEELLDANLSQGEDRQLEEKLQLLRHAQEITDTLSAVAALTADTPDDSAPGDRLTSLEQRLSNVAPHFPQGNELLERLQSLRIDLYDIAFTATDLLDRTDLDLSETDRLEARFDMLQTLLYKYKVSNVDDLITERDRLLDFLDRVDHSAEHLDRLSRAVEDSLQSATQSAEMLTSARRKAADSILPELHELLTELGIAGASFRVSITPTEALSPTGQDSVEFLFATNQGKTLRPIHEIASGGEISRFMLALKTILSARTVLPTVIFDEIDTGVSGEVAEKLGRVMERLSRHLQVIAITHLPQIASLARHQLVVAKALKGDHYVTTIREVTDEERVNEIASMLSGAAVTSQAIENARVLLDHTLKSPK